MYYPYVAIEESVVSRARNSLLQHMLDTYVSESNKVVSTWREFTDADLSFKPRPKSSTVGEILKHQLLSERRFFGEFLGTPEPAADGVLPTTFNLVSVQDRFVELALNRLGFFAGQTDSWWLEVVPFFDVRRERIWIFWRRVLHMAHHRTQLTVYLRLLDRKVPSTYGPTKDVSWSGADPTNTVEAAGRQAPAQHRNNETTLTRSVRTRVEKELIIGKDVSNPARKPCNFRSLYPEARISFPTCGAGWSGFVNPW